MKKGLIIFLSVLLVIILVAVAGMAKFNKQYKALLAEVDQEYNAIENIDLSQIEDSEYTCRFGSIPVIADLTVIVKDHKILSITMNEQTSGPDHEALETLDRILLKQQPKVDAVTGATTSSKVIMIAVNKALTEK